MKKKQQVEKEYSEWEQGRKKREKRKEEEERKTELI